MNIIKEDVNWLTTSHPAKAEQAINKALTHNLRVLSHEIIETVPNVKSIYLTGGYAASEGTVILNEQGINLISDYDLVVITNGKAPIIHTKESLLKDLINIYEMPGHPICEVFAWDARKLHKLPMTKFLFDFQLAKCIYGKEFRTTIPRFSSAEIPCIEGLRLIFNRILGALIPFSPSLFFTKPSARTLRHLTFESVKLILGSCEALLILEGLYSLTQKENIKRFQERLLPKLPEITCRIPSISQVIDKALEYKLLPTAQAEKNAVETWFNSRNFAMMAIALFMERLFKKKESSFEEMVNDFINVNPHPFIMNMMVIASLLKKRNFLSPKLLYRKPSNALLATRLYLLFSVNRNCTLNEVSLEKAHSILAQHTGIKLCQKDFKDDWDALKQCVMNNYIDPYSQTQSFLGKRIAKSFGR